MNVQLRPTAERWRASERTGRMGSAVRLSPPALVPCAVVLLAPVLGVALLRAPLLNMLGYLDPWLYAGFGWTLQHHIQVFGWPYFVDRFPVVLAVAASTGLFGPVAGYFVLHYLLMAGCGALLYLAVRRFASVSTGCAAVCLLMLSPFFVRMVIWDYVTFVTLPCTIAGVALWYLGSTRVRAVWTALASGICLGAAIFSNPGAGFVLPALISVEAIAAIRGGRQDIITSVRRGCAVATGALLTVVVGYLGYRAYNTGSFPLKLMFQGTIDYVRASGQTAPAFQTSPSVFLRADPHIYAPVLLCLGTIMVLGRSLLANTPRSRMAQFAVAYTLLFWVYRFTISSAYVIEQWLYYDLTAVTWAFAMPALLDELGRARDRARWVVVGGVAIAATGVADLVFRSVGPSALSTFNTHIIALVCLLAVGGIVGALAAVLKRGTVGVIAVGMYCAILAVVALAPTRPMAVEGDFGTTGDFSTYPTSLELEAYRAAYDMGQLVDKYDRPDSRVLIWDSPGPLAAVEWENVYGNVSGFTPTAIPILTPAELARLREPTTSRVLAVSTSEAQVRSALPALREHGLDSSEQINGAWAGGKVHYVLIKIRQRS